MSFVPRLDALPEAQRKMWGKLNEVPRHFVLYGGTALALRLGHRQSVDFDFFSSEPVIPDQLRETVSFLIRAETLDVSANTLTVCVFCPEPVKISFFGGLKLGRVNDPEWTNDAVIQVASLLDVAACKMGVVQTRPEMRDYMDVCALLKSGLRLPEMLGAARAVFGAQFNPLISVKALSYFGDGNLNELPAEMKKMLVEAVENVNEICILSKKEGGLAPGAN